METQLRSLPCCCCVHGLIAAAGAGAKGHLFCACRALHTRLIDKRPAASLGNHVKQHCFNLKLTYKVGYIAA